MQLLDQYFEIQNQIHEYFGYVENWVVIPLDDARKYFWRNDGYTVFFAKTVEELELEDGNYYENEIYFQRFLPKWIYRADDFTMICVNTNVDGNKFLQVFDNAKCRENIVTDKKPKEQSVRKYPFDGLTGIAP